MDTLILGYQLVPLAVYKYGDGVWWGTDDSDGNGYGDGRNSYGYAEGYGDKFEKGMSWDYPYHFRNQ